MASKNFFFSNNLIELSKKAAGGISRSDVPIYNPNDAIKNPYEMDIGKKEKEDLKWLLG